MNTAALAAFTSAGIGGFLALIHLVRSKRFLVDWYWTAGMVTLSAEAVYCGLVALATSGDEIIKYQERRLLVVSAIPGLWLLFSITYARGGALARAKGKPMWSVGIVSFLPVFALLARHHLVGFLRFNEANSHLALGLGWAGIVLYAFLLVGSILVVMNLERTFRAAVGTMRWRIKFMLMAVGLLFIVRIYTSSQVLLFRGVDLHLELLNSIALIVAAFLIARSFFRTREVEVDVYPSQSILQNSITVLLAGIYLVLVGVLAKVAAYLGGDNEFALKAFLALVSIVALAIFVQSDRARLHLRKFVSRNFQRPLYDYRTVWRRFTEGTASRVERADLCRSLVKLVADIFQALSVGIWLLDEKRESMVLAGSTFLPDGKAHALELTRPGAGGFMQHFQEHREAVDIDSSESPWAASLREIHPNQFPNGGHRIFVPLISQEEVIGIMTLGDRVGGVMYSEQDFDMLRCVADHVSASLRNVQLSQKLLQAKELEAFQTMAAFFVHDLKNAASTLNLMLQNLPVHFDDPAFRDDALRGVSKTVAHINRLIERLGHLRHEQGVHASPVDLNEMVSSAIEGIEQGTGSLIAKDLSQAAPVMADREQISKVVVNLVLNATEAVEKKGSVKVGTKVEGNWFVLSVEDDGCGMSADFLAKGLFRPFQTTKKNGLGIGMFQSKMIVEGHGGRIAVASEPGKGTKFQVYLPMRPPTS